LSGDRLLLVRVVGSPFVGQPAQGRAVPEAGTLLEVYTDGTVSAYSGKIEYGQGIRDGFARMIAPVFAMRAGDVDVVLGDTARVPWDRGTTGSASTWEQCPGLNGRRAWATCRG
jgi:isoquinoline 1-oxidoreductase